MNVLRVALIALLLQAVSAPRETTGSVEGIVVEAESQRPISGAVVELTGLADGSFKVLSFSTRSSTDGGFLITGIPPGAAYSLVVTNVPNFVPAAYGQKRPGDAWIPISLTAGQRVTGIRIPILELAAIAGRVVDRYGKAIRDVRVAALDVSYREGWRLLQSNRATRTNALGEYRISGIPTGRYVIRVGPHKRRPSSGDTYTYFPAELNPDDAVPIEVSGQTPVEAVDFVIAETDTYRVSGTVIDAATGKAVRDTRVFLVPPKVSPDSIAAREVSSRDGDFEFRDVTPGAYRVFAVTRDSQNAMSGRIPIRVEDLDLRGLSLPVRKDFQVAGRLTLDDTALSNRIDGSQAIVILNAGSRGTIDGSLHGFVPENGPDAVIPPLRAAVQPDGTFVFKGVRSWTYVADVLQSRLYVKAILSGEKDLLRDGEPVDLIDISDLNIVLGSDSGMLEGHAMAHAIVVVVPDEPSRGRRDIYRTAKADGSGRFSFPAVAPGSYKVFSWRGVDPGAWYFAEFLKQDETRAVPILIQPSVTTTVDVPVLSDNPHLR